MPSICLIGNLENKRTRHFVEAVRQTDWKWRIISWERVLDDSDGWAKDIEPGTCIRIDSPGESFAIEKGILARGLEEQSKFNRFDIQALQVLPYERGRILALNQWYLGWQRTLESLEKKLAPLQVQYFNQPSDIAVMFDKPRCNQVLREGGISVPPILGKPRGFDEVMELMRTSKCSRIFIKPCYSSSASGIIAFELQSGRQQAFSSIEVIRDTEGVKLFNSKRVKRYESLAEIRVLVDAICRENIYVERWLPKAGFSGKRFDLRLVVMGNAVRQIVARLSDHPMTNLHLGAKRGDIDSLREIMGQSAWNAALKEAENAMRAFPRSLYGGIDLLVSPGWKKTYVLEVNAFGDLLPHALWHGMDTYALELKVWRELHSREFQVSTTGL